MRKPREPHVHPGASVVCDSSLEREAAGELEVTRVSLRTGNGAEGVPC